jgi:hypothetical protein
MPEPTLETVRSGSVGPAVVILQAQLNLALPSLTPRLNIDGIFGPKTLGRTIEFQRRSGLSIDGVCGPKTWAKLAAVPTPIVPLARPFRKCGNSVEGNAARAANLTTSRGDVRRFGVGPSVGDTSPGSSPILTDPVTKLRFKRVKGDATEQALRVVYGDSIDYNRVFLGEQTGQDNRAFVLTIPAQVFLLAADLTGFVQIANVGGFNPDGGTLLHEFGHVWQAQHHQTPPTYMANCVACQKRAEAANRLAALFDPRLKANRRFPHDFPFSAYGFIPGNDLSEYGGEQVAQQIEKGVAKIRTYVRGKPPLVHDAQNGTSVAPTHIVMQDMRAPGATGLD